MHTALRLLQLLLSVAGMLAVVTVAYIGFALNEYGDLFDPGFWFLPGLFGAAALGAIAGWRVQSRLGRMIIVAVGIEAAMFWIFVPNGWWASGPP